MLQVLIHSWIKGLLNHTSPVFKNLRYQKYLFIILKL